MANVNHLNAMVTQHIFAVWQDPVHICTASLLPVEWQPRKMSFPKPAFGKRSGNATALDDSKTGTRNFWFQFDSARAS